jgi:hypothetical protein
MTGAVFLCCFFAAFAHNFANFAVKQLELNLILTHYYAGI